jgi:hypothetical protein
MIVIENAAMINAVLEPIYRELEISFDPAMTGAVSDAREVQSEAVALAFADVLSAGEGLAASSVDAETLARAATIRTNHEPPHLRERTEPD